MLASIFANLLCLILVSCSFVALLPGAWVFFLPEKFYDWTNKRELWMCSIVALATWAVVLGSLSFIWASSWVIVLGSWITAFLLCQIYVYNDGTFHGYVDASLAMVRMCGIIGVRVFVKEKLDEQSERVVRSYGDVVHDEAKLDRCFLWGGALVAIAPAIFIYVVVAWFNLDAETKARTTTFIYCKPDDDGKVRVNEESCTVVDYGMDVLKILPVLWGNAAGMMAVLRYALGFMLTQDPRIFRCPRPESQKECGGVHEQILAGHK